MKQYTFGDSIPTGAGAGAASLGFASKLAEAMGAILINNARSGGMAIDNTASLLATSMVAGDYAVIMTGTNDQAIYGFDPDKRGFYISSLRAHAVILSCGFVKVSPTTVNFTSNSWSNVGYDNSYATSVIGAKASFTHTGDSVAIGYIRQFNNTAKFKVFVDGIDKGTFDVGGDVRSYLGSQYGCACLVFSGLGDGTHSVEVVCVSANAQNVVYFQWFSSMKPKNKVLFINTPHAVAYTYGGSAANVDAYNAAELVMVSELQALGLDIRYADICSILTPSDMADNVHPNGTSGHPKITTTSYAVLHNDEITYSLCSVYKGSDGKFYVQDQNNFIEVLTK